MSQQVGKAASKWTAKIGDSMVGGQPPTLDDIEEDVGGLKRFTDTLFEGHVCCRWDLKVRELLVMALLLRCDQFLEVLESHPEATPKVTDDGFAGSRHRFARDHLFVCRVKQALDGARVGEVQFDGWVFEARNAFMTRNLPGIPIEKFSLCGGNKNDVRMDPRCFVDHFNALASSVTQNNTHVNVQRLQHTVNDEHQNQQCGSIAESFMLKNFHKVMKSVERIKNRVMGQVPESDAPRLTQDGVIKFSISSKGLTNQTSLTPRCNRCLLH